MSGIYETWARKLRLSFAGAGWGRVWGALSKVIGDFGQRDAIAAISERLPDHAQSPESFSFMGADRDIEFGPSEGYPLRRARLVAAVDQHRLDGTPLGLCLALWWAEFYSVYVIQQNGIAHTITGLPNLDDLKLLPTVPSWYSTSDTGLNPAIPASNDGKPAIAAGTIPWWTIDSGMDAEGNQYNSRFVVLFPVGNSFDGTDLDQLARIRRVIARWRPAHAKCVSIIDQTSGLIWGWPLTQNWGGGGLVRGGSTLTYTP